MLPITRRTAKILAAAVVPASLVIAGATMAAAATNRPAGNARHHSSHFEVRQILSGQDLRHTFVPAGSSQSKSDPLTQPDDITQLGHDLFVGFQNGVGSQGEASTDGNLHGTVVEFTPSGHVVRQWDVKGKVDGLGNDPERHLVIATVNEDSNSSIYTIAPRAEHGDQVQHFTYNQQPLPQGGGTDAVTFFRGHVLLSASAPGTTGKPAPQPTYPAVYTVTFDRHDHVATVRPVFFDEAPATVANVDSSDHGKTVHLALTDPDSSEVAPHSAARFGGEFMLDSQGDLEEIFLGRHHDRGLSVLRLSQSIDDSAWATGRDGRLYATDSSSDSVDVVTGRFRDGTMLVAVTPCNANSAPSTCPAPGFPANYLGSENLWTGQITAVPVSGANLQPKGMLFLGR
jgi:hypothetical protein